MTHQRIIPRDLFNEAKLLNALGFLSLAIHDNVDKIADLIGFEHDGSRFEVELSDCNTLYVANISFFAHTGEQINFYTNYNSRSECPLLFDCYGGLYSGFVFWKGRSGETHFTQEFDLFLYELREML